MKHPFEGKRTPYIALRCGDATANEQTLAAEEMCRLLRYSLTMRERGTEMPEIEQKIIFGLSPPSGPEGKATMVVGIPRAAWEYMSEGKTYQVDLAKVGIPLQFILYGAEDHDAAMKMIEGFVAGQGQAYDDRRREDFSIESVASPADGLLAALKEWKCPACGGAGEHPRRGTSGPAKVPCHICGQTGLHPKARDAIKAYMAPHKPKGN